MNHVYVDSKKTYVFAENAKYSFATGKILAGDDQRPWSVKLLQEPNTRRYFWDDKYCLFNPATGQVNVYDCVSDALLKSYSLSAFTPGINNYFDYDSGTLFISYKDGVRIVRISDGLSDRAAFDRHQAFDNLDETSCYGVSSDGNYLVAGSNQGVGLVVLKKIDSRTGFQGNTTEVLRRDLSIGEIFALHRSNRVVYSAGGALHLLDLDTMRVIWNTAAPVISLRNVYLAPDKQHLHIDLGGERVSSVAFLHDYPGYDYGKYYNQVFGVWGTFKRELCPSNLPADLLPLWELRPRTVRLRLDQGMALESVEDRPPFPVQEQIDRSFSDKDKVVSPSGRNWLKTMCSGIRAMPPPQSWNGAYPQIKSGRRERSRGPIGFCC